VDAAARRRVRHRTHHGAPTTPHASDTGHQ
jgi:hypothetical protein